MSGSRILYVGTEGARGLQFADRGGSTAELTVTVTPSVAAAITYVAESPVDCVVAEPIEGIGPFLDYVSAGEPSIPVVLRIVDGREEPTPPADHFDVACDGEDADVVEAIVRLMEESGERHARSSDDGSAGGGAMGEGRPSPVGTIRVDGNGTIRSVDGAAARAVESEREALIDRHVEDVVGASHATGILATWRDATEVGELREVRTEGNGHAIHATVVPLPNGGAQVVTRSVESRNGEASPTDDPAFVETVLNSLSDICFVLDFELSFVHWNDRLNAVTGYDDVEIEAMGPLAFFPGESREVAADALAEIMETGYASRELDLLTRYGERIPYEFTGSLVYDEIGNPEYFCGVARDVTERREAQTALRESEQQLNSLIEGVTDYAIFRVGTEGAVESWNSGSETITGYTEEEILGENISVFYTDAAVEAGLPERSLAEAGEQGRIEEEGFRLRADGSRFWAHVVMTALRNDDGTLEGFVKVTRDMTERREYEQRLRYEKALTDRVLDTSPVGITVYSHDGSIVRSNRYAREIMGPTEDWGVETTAEEWEIFDWDGDPIPAEDWPYTTVLETGEAVYDWECYVDHPDRGRLWLSLNAAPVVADDGTVGEVIITTEDVTELKERHDEFRYERNQTEELLKTAPVAVSVKDADGETVLANQRAQDLLGLPEREIIEHSDGASEWGILDASGETLDAEETPTARALSTGEPVLEEEMTIERPNGERVWFSVNAAPVYNPDGSVERVITTAEDITALKERECELERRRAQLDSTVEELRRSNAELEQFAYVASHDLKEPLRMISSYLQLIERRYAEELDEDATEFIDYAVDGAERMRSMISALLAYSRLDKEGESFEPVDCNDVVDSVLSNLEIAIAETDAEVSVEELPTLVGDGAQLRQLLQNLVGNAIAYAGESAPRISISAENRGDEWVFVVEDDGVGVPADRIERIFDLFASDPTRGGTGIGLAICQKIVEGHGGQIWVESEPGVGSIFYFTIPGERGRDASRAAAQRA